MLKYLFECEFQDGSVMTQTQDDVSAVDPKRSQFFDVLEKDKANPIVRFALTGEDKYLLVDLRDGHFELNGTSFNCHETMPDAIRRLIFYRTHQAVTTQTADGKLLDSLDSITGYTIGWQCTINGKNFKETVTIN